MVVLLDECPIQCSSWNAEGVRISISSFITAKGIIHELRRKAGGHILTWFSIKTLCFTPRFIRMKFGHIFAWSFIESSGLIQRLYWNARGHTSTWFFFKSMYLSTGYVGMRSGCIWQWISFEPPGLFIGFVEMTEVSHFHKVFPECHLYRPSVMSDFGGFCFDMVFPQSPCLIHL